MVWIVVTINLGLSLGLMWATWQVWQLRSVLASVVEKIEGYALACQRGLSVSPPAITIAQRGVGSLRGKKQALVSQLQRVLSIVTVVGRLQYWIIAFPRKRSRLQKSKSYKPGRSDRNGQWLG